MKVQVRRILAGNTALPGHPARVAVIREGRSPGSRVFVLSPAFPVQDQWRSGATLRLQLRGQRRLFTGFPLGSAAIQTNHGKEPSHRKSSLRMPNRETQLRRFWSQHPTFLRLVKPAQQDRRQVHRHLVAADKQQHRLNRAGRQNRQEERNIPVAG